MNLYLVTLEAIECYIVAYSPEKALNLLYEKLEGIKSISEFSKNFVSIQCLGGSGGGGIYDTGLFIHEECSVGQSD